jgi:uncharacterized protein (TIGR03086 family)
MDLLDALDMSFREFDQRLDAVEPPQWGLGTPCEGWSICDLVDHMWFGCMAHLRFFEGVPYRQLIAERPPTLSPETVGDQYRSVAAELVDLLRRPGSLEREVRYPGRRDTKGSHIAVFRLWDNVVHTWDLASALGTDATIDEVLVAFTMEQIAPHLDMYRSLGAVAQPSEVEAADCSLQSRLLRLSGRVG